MSKKLKSAATLVWKSLCRHGNEELRAFSRFPRQICLFKPSNWCLSLYLSFVLCCSALALETPTCAERTAVKLDFPARRRRMQTCKVSKLYSLSGRGAGAPLSSHATPLSSHAELGPCAADVVVVQGSSPRINAIRKENFVLKRGHKRWLLIFVFHIGSALKCNAAASH